MAGPTCLRFILKLENVPNGCLGFQLELVPAAIIPSFVPLRLLPPATIVTVCLLSAPAPSHHLKLPSMSNPSRYWNKIIFIRYMLCLLGVGWRTNVSLILSHLVAMILVVKRCELRQSALIELSQSQWQRIFFLSINIQCSNFNACRVWYWFNWPQKILSLPV